jgi:group II intron reverse transcriptase/maturase
VNIVAFERGLEARIAALAADLACRRYRPDALRRVTIPKPAGGARELAIPTVRDRVAQTAVAQWLGARLDPAMDEGSFGYRPRRSVDLALAALRRAHHAGLCWTLDADIRAFFDETPHRLLMSDLRACEGDVRVIEVVELWLQSFGAKGRGLSQGAPISPVLANMFLDPVDRAFAKRGMSLVRYADDFVVSVATQARARSAWRLAGRLLARRGLRLNLAKTGIRAPGEAFVFLGEVVQAPRKARRPCSRA